MIRATNFLIGMSALLLLSGCIPKPQLTLPEKIQIERSASLSDETSAFNPANPPEQARTRIETAPAPPSGQRRVYKEQPAAVTARDTAEVVSVNLDQIPLPTFIKVVYAEILKRQVQIDPQVAQRRDLVTFRTPVGQSVEGLERALTVLLRSYGVSVVDVGGVIRAVPQTASVDYLPELRRGNALPETPTPLRPIFQLVELSSVRANEITGWLKSLLGDRVTVKDDVRNNAVILIGTSEAVQSALNAIAFLDRPIMQGKNSLRIVPAFTDANSLANQLRDILAAEGYSVAPPNVPLSGGVRYPIMVLAIEDANTVLVFANKKEILGHARSWALEIDRPRGNSGQNSYFSYQVKNTSAESVARTLRSLIASSDKSDKTASGKEKETDRSLVSVAGLVVDAATNSLIFRREFGDHQEIISLLRTLDRPAPSVLVEVTVAEVRLTDNMQLGVEWLIRGGLGSGDFTASTLSGLGLGTAGLTIKKLTSAGETRAVLNALASANYATILSSPSIVSRSGEQAQIQVGQEVPVITSQQSTLSATAGAGDTGVLQTVQYRSTGVIFKVLPTVFSRDMVNLKIEQEVSSAQETTTGVTASPTISTRKLETEMALRSGETVLIGGLMSTTTSDGKTGVPGLKDVPILGNLFRKDVSSTDKTELLVLISPYVIGDDAAASRLVDAFKRRFTELQPASARDFQEE